MTNTAAEAEPDLPNGYFASETTEFLLKSRNRKSSAERYELQRELIRRVSECGEYDFLLALITSRSFSRKALGSFFVGEILDKTGLVWPALRKTLTSWSDEGVHEFRYRFVEFVVITRYYDDKIARGMMRCLSDDSNFVRQSAIEWLCWVHPSIYASFDQFCLKENLSNGKIDGKSKLHARLSRAVQIAALVRQGKSIDFILKKVKFEEFETFEYLRKFENRFYKRASKWRDAQEEHDSTLNDS
jgi:hypothetical protein